MNYRYEIYELNAQSIIGYYDYLSQSETYDFNLNERNTASCISRTNSHEENAVFYQLLYSIYSKEHSIDKFKDDRFEYMNKSFPIVKYIQSAIKDKLVYLDFFGVFTEHNIIKRRKYESISSELFDSGIRLTLPGCETHTFVPLLKSGSMSRTSRISFIREDYYKIIYPRLSFDLFQEDKPYQISKILAYQGLYLSSGIRCELNELNKDSVVVINDVDYPDPTPLRYNTALSRDIVRTHIEKAIFASNKKEYYKLTEELIYWVNSIKHPNRQTYYNFEYENDFSGALPEKLYASFGMYESFGDIPEKDLLEKRENVELLKMYINTHFILLKLDELKDDNDLKYFENLNRNITHNLFDGLGLIDIGLMKKINKEYLGVQHEPFHYSVQMRMPYIKGMLHAVDLKTWFRSSNKSYIVDVFNNKKDTSKIKILLTKSQFKCIKWIKGIQNRIEGYSSEMDYYFNLFNKFNHSLYITNTDKVYDNHETVLNYQVLHTPALSLVDFKHLLKKGNTYYRNVCIDERTQVDLLKTNHDSKHSSYNYDDSEFFIYSDILKKNPYFIRDPFFKNRLKNYQSTLLRNMKMGRVSIDGTVKYLCGDLLHFLLKITKNRDVFDLGDKFYIPRLSNQLNINKKYSIIRNPHITSNELLSIPPASNEAHKVRDIYFGHLRDVIMTSASSGNMYTMQTADTDGDMVKLILDDTYNKAVENAVKQNNGRTLFFPELEGNKEKLTKTSIFETTKNTFASRVGIISNDAFSHSLKAYNENNSDLKKRNEHKVKAQQLSFIVSAEIDAAKSGKQPNYVQAKFTEKFIKYKDLVKNRRKEYIKFKNTSESPNLYYLEENAEEVKKAVKEAKRQKNKLKEEFYRFNFEKDENWKDNLSKELLVAIEPLFLAYLDILPTLGYMNKETEKESPVMRLIRHIISEQYDESISKINIIDDIISKLIKIDASDLKDLKEKNLKDRWQFKHNNKDTYLENLFQNLLNQNEISLLSNFSCSGHKLLYSCITESISINERLDQDKILHVTSFNRTVNYIDNIYSKRGLEGKRNTKNLVKSLWSRSDSLDNLCNEYSDVNGLSSEIDKSKISDSIIKLDKRLKKIRKNVLSNDVSILEEVEKHYKMLSLHTVGEGNEPKETSLIRQEIYYTVLEQLENTFEEYSVPMNEVVKYIYYFRKQDPSLRFIFNICRNFILDEVAQYSEVNDNA